MCVTWAAAHLGEKFPHFRAGSVSEKILLKTSAISKQKVRCSLIDDVSREQIECGIDVAEAFGVDQPVLPFSGGALGLVEKATEILARCLAIPRLVSAADDDIHTGPTLLAKIIPPSCEERVQLFELDAHRQLRSLECV